MQSAFNVTNSFYFYESPTKVRAVVDGDKKNVILLVEDEVLVAAIAAENLREIGLEVLEATTAKAALDLAGSSKHLKAAIVDIGLPDRRGDELAGELRKLHAGLPIVIATGHSGDAVRKDLRDSGNVAVLGKPYDLKDLRAALVSVGISA